MLWGFRGTLQHGAFTNENFREGVADLPSRATARRRRQRRKVPEQSFQPFTPSRDCRVDRNETGASGPRGGCARDFVKDFELHGRVYV